MPRGSKPGERRGGRQKGTPNRNTQELRQLIQHIYPDEEFWDDIRKFSKKGNMLAARLRAEYAHGKARDVTDASDTVNAMEIAAQFAQMVAIAGTGSAASGNSGVSSGSGEVQDNARGATVVQDGDCKEDAG